MVSKIPRIYTDTSVFGGVYDEEFEEASQLFFKQTERGDFLLVSSAIVERELREAPQEVKSFYEKMLSGIEIVEVTMEAIELQQAYLNEGILSPQRAVDALHVALATTAHVDIIASWNFKHIVHFDKIRLFNAVNQLKGWNPLAIYSPKEVINYED